MLMTAGREFIAKSHPSDNQRKSCCLLLQQQQQLLFCFFTTSQLQSVFHLFLFYNQKNSQLLNLNTQQTLRTRRFHAQTTQNLTKSTIQSRNPQRRDPNRNKNQVLRDFFFFCGESVMIRQAGNSVCYIACYCFYLTIDN